jgi:hypothetical protein
MTRQEIFDKVVSHFAVQREAAAEYWMCMYRTPDGRKCAIGALIPDEVYSKRLEDKSVGTLLLEFPDIMRASGLSDGDLCFLFALQDVHDGCASSNKPFLNYFSHSMRLLADIYKLDDSSLVLLGEQGAG